MRIKDIGKDQASLEDNVVAEGGGLPDEPEQVSLPQAVSPALVESHEKPLPAVTAIPSIEPVLATRTQTEPVPVDLPTFEPTPVATLAPSPALITKPAPVKALGAAIGTDEVFLLSRLDGEYTLQVLAAIKPDSLRAYMQRQPNKEKLYLYQGVREGKQRYVVVAGIYPTREQALAARQLLPDEQASAGPWPRPIKAIKQEISDNQRH